MESTKKITGNEQFETVEQGKELLKQVEKQLHECFEAVRRSAKEGTTQEYRSLVDEHYELKKVKQKVQYRLASIVRAQMMSRKEG